MSREEYMRALPVYKQYQCAICHTSPSPTPSAAGLNAFGADFKSNGYKWTYSLAIKDSDGDGWANGIELGDDNGDGIASVDSERSNPGDGRNTPNSIPRKTWGIIKALFED